METAFNQFVDALGLRGMMLMGLLVVFSMVCQMIGKLIPEDKTGILGFIRGACKVLGLYVSNRLHAGVSVADVAKDVVSHDVVDKANRNAKAIETIKDAAVIVKRGNRGKFEKVQSPALVGLLTLMLAIPLLAGCTPKQTRRIEDIAVAVCNSQKAAQALLDSAAASKSKVRAQQVLDGLRVACPLLYDKLDRRAALAVTE